MSSVSPTPNLPAKSPYGSALFDTSIKVATPDIIITDEEPIPVDVVSNLLFELIGGIELISISRNDIINGQRVSYNLVGNLDALERMYNPLNMFRLIGSSKEFFENFGIRFVVHVPENGTAPPPVYIDVANSTPGASVVIADRYTGETVADGSAPELITTYQEAVDYIETNYPTRDIVYIDPTTGDLIVDVTAMEVNERLDIEVLTSGSLQDDTIY